VFQGFHNTLREQDEHSTRLRYIAFNEKAILAREEYIPCRLKHVSDGYVSDSQLDPDDLAIPCTANALFNYRKGEQ
jgi:hypothetical protein